MKRRYRILAAAVTLALCGFTGMNVVQAETLKTQVQVDDAIRDLPADNTIYKDTADPDTIHLITHYSGKPDSPVTTSVWGQDAALSVGRAANQDLTISTDYRGNNSQFDVGASAMAGGSDSTQGSVTFHDLNALNLSVSDSTVRHGDYSPATATTANLYAGVNGSITVDSSVGTLNANNTVNVGIQRSGGYGVRYNIMASPGGQLSVQAPTVNLTRNGIASGIVLEGGTSNGSDVTDRTTRIEIGTDERPIDTLNLENTQMHSDVAGMERSQAFNYGGYVNDNVGVDLYGSTIHDSEISLQARNINISNSSSAIHVGSGSESRAVRLRIGNANHWVENLNLLDNNNGIATVGAGNTQTDIYARNINITTRPTGPVNLGTPQDSAEQGIVTGTSATLNIHTGTGENGLTITGSGYRGDYINSIGMYNQLRDSVLNVREGDVNISGYTVGAYAYNGGNINFGNNTDGSQGIDNASGNLNIFDTNRGLVSLNHGNDGRTLPAANLNLHVNNLYLNNNVNFPILAGGIDTSTSGAKGNITVRTDGTAYIQSNDLYRRPAIRNYGTGTININTEGNGDTQITGMVDNRNNGQVNISLNSSNSFLDGTAFNTGTTGTLNMTVRNGGRWLLDNITSSRINGTYYDSYISNLNLHDNGIVDLSHEGATTANGRYRTLGVSSLTDDGGASGTLVFGTNLAASAEDKNVTGHSDQLIIRDSSRGNYNIMINDHSNITGQAVDDGYVLLVRDQSSDGQDQARFQGATSDSANGGLYVQRHGSLQNGGLFTKPVEITDEAPSASNGHDGYSGVPASGRNWYARINSSLTPDVPVAPTDNARHNISFASGRYANLFLEEDTLRKRIGDLREGKDRGIWVRMYRGEVTADGMGGDMTYNTYQIGFDHEIKKTEDSIQYAGISYHHRDMNYNVSGFTHDSEGDADVGSLYWTKLKNDGQYLDVVGRFGRMKGKMDTYGEFPERGRWSSPYQGLSVEYGKQFRKENGWYLEPQAQLTYSHLSRGSYTTTQGTHASLSSINSLIGRIGTTFGRKTRSGDYYGMLFWHHEFDGNASYHFLDKNGDTLDGHHDYGGTWLTVGVGGEYRPSDKFTIYADVQKSFGGDVRQKWVWNAGMRWNF